MTYKEKLSYLAGLLDGEGSISLWKDYHKDYLKRTKRGFGWRFIIHISNTDRMLMDWLEKNFKDYGIVRSFWDKRIGLKRKYDWFMSPNNIRKLLPRLLPYLVLKKKRAELILEALTLIKEHKSRYTPHDKRLREIHQEMKKLNSKGIADIVSRFKKK